MRLTAPQNFDCNVTADPPDPTWKALDDLILTNATAAAITTTVTATTKLLNLVQG